MTTKEIRSRLRAILIVDQENERNMHALGRISEIRIAITDLMRDLDNHKQRIRTTKTTKL